MANTVIGLFDEASEARRAVQELTAAGFERDRIDVTTAEASSGGEGGDGETYGNEGFTDQIGNFFTSLFGDDDRDRAGRYADTMSRGSTLVTVHADSRDEAERAASLLDAAGAVDVDERAAQYRAEASTGTEAQTGTEARGRTQEQAAIPVVEEELQVGKRVVEQGGVRVRSRVIERPVEESIRLREEHIRVERRPVDRPLTAADADAFREGSFELTERAEVPVVAKEARVVEEVAVGKEVEEHTETVRDTVRSTDVDVEQVEPGRVKRGKASGR